MSNGPTLLEAATMNALAYLKVEERGDEVKGWKVVDRQHGLGVDRWQSEDGYTYLAVAGTRAVRRDVIDSVKIFFGQTPDSRIQELNDYIREHCADALANEQLAVGGHSLGGLIAYGVAAEFHLPALIQNAPGFFKAAPDASRCDKVVEIRTAGDLVSDWGSNAAHLITLQDKEAGGSIKLRHAILRQNALIAKDEVLGKVTLTSVGVLDHEANLDTDPTGNTFRSMFKSWRRLREHRMAEMSGAVMAPAFRPLKPQP